jgi:putative membrane protein
MSAPAKTFNLEQRSRFWINTISGVIPVIVIILLGIQKKAELGDWTKDLPHVIGLVNSLTCVTLILGLIFIKSNKVKAHRLMMMTSVVLGAIFLICYLTYHLSNPENRFTGEGYVRYIYLFLLITHILFSIFVLPLVLRALFYAVTRQFDRHKKIVRFAYPIWLYVSLSGVTVYLMLYQLFPSK